MNLVEDSTAKRFSMWTSRTDLGVSQRASYNKRSEAVESAEKYWLTPVGLNRVFVCDAEDSDAIVFERVYATAPRVRKPT